MNAANARWSRQQSRAAGTQWYSEPSLSNPWELLTSLACRQRRLPNLSWFGPGANAVSGPSVAGSMGEGTIHAYIVNMGTDKPLAHDSLRCGPTSPCSGPLMGDVRFPIARRGRLCSDITPGTKMGSPKDEVSSLLQKLPDDASFEDIQYHLYFLEKVRRGLERADAEGSISHDAAKQRLGKWLAR